MRERGRDKKRGREREKGEREGGRKRERERREGWKEKEGERKERDRGRKRERARKERGRDRQLVLCSSVFWQPWRVLKLGLTFLLQMLSLTILTRAGLQDWTSERDESSHKPHETQG